MTRAAGVQVARGRIVLVQEQRFRLVAEGGRSLRLTLAHDAPLGTDDLRRFCEEGTPVTVAYTGEPGLTSGVAHRVVRDPSSAASQDGPAEDTPPAGRPTGLRRGQGAATSNGRRLARLRGALRDWALPRQLRGQDPLGSAAESEGSRRLRPRLEEADRVGTSICPYCAVGCAQLVYARGNDVLHVEGDPRSPINQGTLCPKGSATIGWMTSPQRLTTVRYRAPYADHWEEKPLEWAMDRIARLVKQTRDETFVRQLPDGVVVNHTLALAELGGATLDNEENYLIKKLCCGLGMVFVENQARV